MRHGGAQRGVPERSPTWLFGPVVALSLVGSFAGGCGSSDYGDSLDGATSQASFERVLSVPRSPVWLLVVDDRPDAADLRASVAAAIESDAQRRVDRATGPTCGAQPDPAAWSPIDWSVVVVHPSASGDARVTSPADDARLRWSEHRPSASGAAAFLAAVEAALEPREDGPEFAPLAALKELGSLVAGQRAAANARETALLAALPPESERVAMPLLALARDDASASEPEQNVLSPSSAVQFLNPVVPRPSSEATAACELGSSASTARVDRWLRAQRAEVGIEAWALWPCTGNPFLRLSIDPPCAPECRRLSAVENDDGAAACLILVETTAASCDARFGWLDPEDDDGVRRPRVVTSGDQAARICEIRQLSGAALASCRESRECEACEPGWCLTDVTEIVQPCPLDRPFPLRYVGGANVAAPAVATITCNFRRESP